MVDYLREGALIKATVLIAFTEWMLCQELTPQFLPRAVISTFGCFAASSISFTLALFGCAISCWSVGWS